jgi:rifampin ADP-ribosylating transferase
MEFDPNNKVIQLCSQGMEAEFAGNIGQAHALFQQAWDLAKDDFEAFTVAHYLARHQEDPKEMLKWEVTAYRVMRVLSGGFIVHAGFSCLYLTFFAFSRRIFGPNPVTTFCFAVKYL